VTLAELNVAGRDEFVDAVGWVFEHSPWVAERAWERRPFASLTSLHDAMTNVVAGAGRGEQLALLRAHPDLGTRCRTAGSDVGARSGGDGNPDLPTTDASAREQSSAGLNLLTRDELDRLSRLNAAYRGKFGFPFLLAVKRSTPGQIVHALESRLPRTYDEELLEGLRQVAQIARFRLEECLSG